MQLRTGDTVEMTLGAAGTAMGLDDAVVATVHVAAAAEPAAAAAAAAMVLTALPPRPCYMSENLGALPASALSKVGQSRLTVSKPALKARLVSAL